MLNLLYSPKKERRKKKHFSFPKERDLSSNKTKTKNKKNNQKPESILSKDKFISKYFEKLKTVKKEKFEKPFLIS